MSSSDNNCNTKPDNIVLCPSAQSFNTASSPHSYCPTELKSAVRTLSLEQPPNTWYMDMGATSHMTSHRGTLSPYFSSSKNNSIIVGNGHAIPICVYGSTHVSFPHHHFQLNNVLHAPQLIKNLISVQKFTTDNSGMIEFYPFDFSMKDLMTGTTLMRCDSFHHQVRLHLLPL